MLAPGRFFYFISRVKWYIWLDSTVLGKGHQIDFKGMKHSNLLILIMIYGVLFGFLYWLVSAYPGDDLGDRIQYLIMLLRQNDNVLIKATIIYAVCLSIPYIPGGLGWVIVTVTGFKGLCYFMVGSLASMGINFIIGRRFPFVMQMFKQHISKHLSLKKWWPKDGKMNIFNIVWRYVEEDRTGRKIAGILRWLPLKIRFNEQTLIAMAILMPVNLVVGGSGGLSLVCGEECTISFSHYMRIVFWTHLILGLIPYIAFLLLN